VVVFGVVVGRGGGVESWGLVAIKKGELRFLLLVARNVDKLSNIFLEVLF
jgi:hypothetical protein